MYFVEEVDILSVADFSEDPTAYQDMSDELGVHFTGDSDVSAPAAAVFIAPSVGDDFSVGATIRSDTDAGGFLFAVVDSTESVIQLGVRVTSVGRTTSNVTLYLAAAAAADGDEDGEGTYASAVMAAFVLPSDELVGRWVELALTDDGDRISLYVDCRRRETVTVYQRRGPVTFVDGSIVYVAQAGGKFGQKFEVGRIVEKTYRVENGRIR